MQWVTIANFDTPPLAHLALGVLTEEGIEATLRNETIVASVWDAGQASQGVELRVRLEDGLRATELVEDLRYGTEPRAHLLPPEFRDDPAEPSPDRRRATIEALAGRAFKTAGIGLVFFPLQVYSLFLVHELWSRYPPAEWSPTARRDVRRALALDLVLLTMIALLVAWTVMA